MKKTLVLSILFLSCSYFGHAQVTFQKVYDKKNVDCNSVQSTFDGGFILAGTRPNINGRCDIGLTKINSVGTLVWTKSFGGIGATYGWFAQQTSDWGYIVGGYNQPGMGGVYQIYVVKTDSSGTYQWSKSYGGGILSSYRAYQIKQTTDGGYIICGTAQRNIFGPYTAFLMKINSIGDTVWTKAYSANRGSEGFGVEQNMDGGYSLIGNISDSLTTFVTNALLVKTDSNGDTLWTKSIGATSNSCFVSANSIKQTNDNGYIITGKTSSFGAGSDDVFLTKTDLNGNPIWTKTFGGIRTDRGISVTQTQDNGYIIAGYTFSFGNFAGEYYLIRTNSNGDTLWTKRYGSTFWNYASYVIQTLDGGYIISGSSGGFGNYGMYVVKTDANGNSGCYENNTPTIVTSPAFHLTSCKINLFSGVTTSIPSTVSGNAGFDSTLCFTEGIIESNQINVPINIFPNPFSMQTTLHTGNPLHSATLNFYNCFGQSVKQIKNISGNTFTLHRDNLPNGLYLLHLIQDNKIITTDKLLIVD